MAFTLFLPDEGTVHIPDHIHNNLAAFRAWAGDNGLPEKARVDFFRGDVWVDLSKQQIYTHVCLRGEIASVLHGLAKCEHLGMFFGSGALVTNVAADWSGNPDGTFATDRTLRSGRLRLVPAANGGYDELEGIPDMVLEVVSDSSEKKDNQTLMDAYWVAGIPEYWLVDARGAEVEFDIFKHGPKGYAAARKPAGWVKSGVFGRAFRLARGTNAQEKPEFTLEVK